MPRRVKGSVVESAKVLLVKADKLDTEAEVELEVAHPAKKIITGKRKRGRKR
jgi:hypothetical protein